MLNNKDVTYNNLPVFINSKYYEDVVNKEGALSKEDEEKADQYYKADLSYSAPYVWDSLNPFSQY